MNTTVSVNLKVNAEKKKEFDLICKQLGLTSSSALNIFINQFISHRGFPFDVRLTNNEVEFAKKMDLRYEEMQEGKFVKHDLIEK